MSLHGTENILRKLQSTLLQAGNAGKDPRRYAVSGPRMLLYHPILAIWHLICSMREKRKAKA